MMRQELETRGVTVDPVAPVRLEVRLIYRTLSGTLSRIVITVLNDPEVRAHLAIAR